MKALVGAFNQEKALVGAFSVIVQPLVEPMDQFAALHQARAEDHRPPPVRGSAASLQPPGHDCDGLPAEAGLSLALLD